MKNTRSCCPTCGRPTLPTPIRQAFEAVAVDLATMTDPERLAHYKRTAPREDLQFIANNRHTSEELRARIQAIKTPTKPAIVEIRCLWRRERNEADRAAGIPFLRWIRPEDSADTVDDGCRMAVA